MIKCLPTNVFFSTFALMKKGSKLYDLTVRILSLIFCVLVIIGISLARDGKAVGISLKDSESESAAVSADTAAVTILTNGAMVVNTTNMTKGIQGYAGPTPLKMYIRNGRIDSIEVLGNVETPEFLEAVTGEILPQYKGKTVNEALKMNVDAVSGATFSSKAIKANISVALRTAANSAEAQQQSAAAKWFSNFIEDLGWGETCAIIVALLAAILPLFIKNKTYRLLQMLLNVAVLGLWTGTFVNYSALVGYASNPSNLLRSLAMLILVCVAFLYPLFGRRGHYCAWCCPLGSAQDLAFRPKGKWLNQWRKRMAPSGNTLTMLRKFRLLLWTVLILLSWLGITFAWMDYELFSAFIWQSAAWIVIALCILTIIIGVFIPRPYCRFICPTGTLLKML